MMEWRYRRPASLLDVSLAFNRYVLRFSLSIAGLVRSVAYRQLLNSALDENVDDGDDGGERTCSDGIEHICDMMGEPQSIFPLVGGSELHISVYI